jgi:hypothetical protein
VLGLSLRYGGILALGVAVVGSVVGYLVDGPAGLASALIGTALAAAFMGLTAVSILVAERVTKGRSGSGAFFGIVTGAWAAKVVVFAVVAFLLRDQAWVSPYVFFFTTLVVVAGSLVADGIALSRARVPYVGDIDLPGHEKPHD